MPRFAIGNRLDAALSLAALGVCAATGLASLARAAWLLELLSHFRLQYLALLIVLAGILVTRRRWRTAAAVLPFALLNTVALAPYWPQPQSAVAAGPSIELMTANLNGNNDDYARFVALARGEAADLMLLLEVDPGWARALEPFAAEYPYRVELTRDDLFGIALLSRLPLADSRILDLHGAPAVDTRILLADGREMRLVGVHLRPPTSAALAATRNAQLAQLLPLVAAETGPLIAAGDFNVTPYSPYLRGWLDASGLRDPRRGRGFGITWPTFVPILGVPIDHCLVSEHFIVADQHRGPAFGSDHYPIITRLQLRGTQ